MQGAAVGQHVDFIGTLVRRTYRPGNKYIQLVFEAAGTSRLSLTRSPSLAKSLSVGKRYRISGSIRRIGKKAYVHEPVAILLPYTSKHSRHFRWASLAALMILVVIGGAYLASHHQLHATPAARRSPTATAVSNPTHTDTTPTTSNIPTSVSTASPVVAPKKTTAIIKQPQSTPSATQTPTSVQTTPNNTVTQTPDDNTAADASTPPAETGDSDSSSNPPADDSSTTPPGDDTGTSTLPPLDNNPIE